MDIIGLSAAQDRGLEVKRNEHEMKRINRDVHTSRASSSLFWDQDWMPWNLARNAAAHYKNNENASDDHDKCAHARSYCQHRHGHMRPHESVRRIGCKGCWERNFWWRSRGKQEQVPLGRWGDSGLRSKTTMFNSFLLVRNQDTSIRNRTTYCTYQSRRSRELENDVTSLECLVLRKLLTSLGWRHSFLCQHTKPCILINDW